MLLGLRREYDLRSRPWCRGIACLAVPFRARPTSTEDRFSVAVGLCLARLR